MSAYKQSSPAGPYTYAPNAESSSQNYPIHLSMGERTIYVFKVEGETQFVVFKQGFNAGSDPHCKQVIGSGFVPEHALHSARLALSRAELSPADFQSRLVGCKFSTAFDKTPVLKHVVLDSNGDEIGRGEYREAACQQALHRMLIGAVDATLEEFRAISVLVNVERGGKDSYGWLYADTESQDSVRRLVRAGFAVNPTFRNAAESCLEARKNLATARPTRAISQRAQQRKAQRDESHVSADELRENELFSALLEKVHECLLSLPTEAELVTCPLTPADGLWTGQIIAHTHRTSPESALRHAHQEFVANAIRLQQEVASDLAEYQEAPCTAA